MRAYKATISNDSESHEGAIYHAVVLFAETFAGAAMEAEAALVVLKDALKDNGLPKESYDTLEVDECEYVCEVVGRFGMMPHEQGDAAKSVEEWAERLARKTKKEID